MIINHPLLGPRDASEFVYLGDASLMARPNPKSNTALQDFTDYIYLRKNTPSELRELWFHEQGDRSWLVVTRNVSTHEISNVELAKEVSRDVSREKTKPTS